MTLAPHHIIETILDMGARHPTWREPKALPGLVALLRQAVLFDFGAVHPAMEHKEFALDLYERGLFGLPFPVTAFAFAGKPNNNPRVTAPARTSALMLLTEREKRISAGSRGCGKRTEGRNEPCPEDAEKARMTDLA